MLLGNLLNDKYLVKEVLGQGGFGVTYKAEDTVSGYDVAIKEHFPEHVAELIDGHVVPSKDEQKATFSKLLERFIEEAKILIRITRNNKNYRDKDSELKYGIVDVYDVFTENGTAYMVMKCLDGITLTKYFQHLGSAMTIASWLPVMKSVMNSLDIVHNEVIGESALIHRDLKPDNIIVQHNDNNEITGTVLIDFGSARYTGIQSIDSEFVMLTPGYAPPEQFSCNLNLQGAWTDIYSLGAISYEALTLKGVTDSRVRQTDISNDHPDPVQPLGELLNAQQNPALEAIHCSLRLKVSERPRTICELRQMLSVSRLGDSRKVAQESERPSNNVNWENQNSDINSDIEDENLNLSKDPSFFKMLLVGFIWPFKMLLVGFIWPFKMLWKIVRLLLQFLQEVLKFLLKLLMWVALTALVVMIVFFLIKIIEP